MGSLVCHFAIYYHFLIIVVDKCPVCALCLQNEEDEMFPHLPPMPKQSLAKVVSVETQPAVQQTTKPLNTPLPTLGGNNTVHPGEQAVDIEAPPVSLPGGVEMQQRLTGSVAQPQPQVQLQEQVVAQPQPQVQLQEQVVAQPQPQVQLQGQVVEQPQGHPMTVPVGVPVGTTGDGIANAMGYDTIGDGRMDSLDTTGDSRPDVYVGPPQPGNGNVLVPQEQQQTQQQQHPVVRPNVQPLGVIPVDTTGDGIPSQGHDTTGDGQMDSLDTDGDGRPDVILHP